MTTRPQRVRRDGATRLARWRQGWALALRLARRDIRRHKSRSALILVLVVAPVLLIAAFATAIRTGDVTVAESLPVRLGHAQAEITNVDGTQFEQLPDGSTHNGTGVDARPFGDHQAGEPWTTAQLTALTGGRIVTAEYPTLFAVEGTRLTRLRTLAMPTADLPNAGLATLTGGRWPRAADEVLVTEQGRRKGLPADGGMTVRLADGTTDQPVRVVGTAAARDAEFRSYDVVTVDRTGAEPGSGVWLLLRDRPVYWAEVRDWNSYGLLVVSRAVVENPPPLEEQPAELVAQQGLNQGSYAALLVLVTLALLIETSLLAGPAFAVSAVRRRRTLAQVAANGADRAQLRRTVLAEALLLGAAGAVAGAMTGVVAGWLTLTAYSRIEPISSPGPLDVPWPTLVLLVVAATGAALVAAFVPARGASQIAIADVLAGRERSQPVRLLAPALGLSLVLVAAGTIAATFALGGSEAGLWLRAMAAGVLVIGVLLLVPALLGGLGRLAPGLPLTLRLPVRDAARQRGRSGSAVAAVVATVATLTIFSVANASDDAHQRVSYTSDRTPGHGYLTPERTDAPAATTIEEIRRQHPDWVVIERATLGSYVDAGTNTESEIVGVVPPGCTPEDSLGMNGAGDETYQRCQRLGAGEIDGSVQTLPQAAADGSTAADRVRAALARGAILLEDPKPVVHGQITLAVGRVSGGPADRVDRVLKVEAVVVSRADLLAAARLPLTDAHTNPNGYVGVGLLPPAGLLTSEAAGALDLPTELGYLEVIDPNGPISERDEAALNERVLSPISVERGYRSNLNPLLGGLLGVAGALVLVAALVATALAQAESRADHATLAALGSPPGLRRRLAAGQALVVAGLGSTLGLAAGLLPGGAMALAFTARTGRDPLTGELIPGPGLVVVPWTPLLAVVVGVPLLAALVAAVAVRRTPLLTRRLT